MKFTILGSAGFIGSHLSNHLKAQGVECLTPEIRDLNDYNKSFGHVIYAIGITSDFRVKPFETIEAHVCTLKRFLENAKFDSFLYLSSARMYSESGASEEESICVNPLNSNDLYNISKLLGESLCLSLDKPTVRIVRLSNVFGNNYNSSDFLFSIIRDAVDKKKIVLHTTLDSEKDYVNIKDVVNLLPQISLMGKHRMYNVASGKNTKTREIVNELARITSCVCEVIPNAEEHSFPQISIKKIQDEFKFKPSYLLDNFEDLVNSFKITDSKTKANFDL